MAKKNDRKEAIKKRVDAVKEAWVLDALEEVLDPRAVPPLTDEEYAEMQEIKRRYLKGESKASTWPEVKKRLMRELRS